MTIASAQSATPLDARGIALQAFRALGSLKMTVALFAFSLVLVFAGTLAQHHLNMLEVKERYFTCWIATLHLEDVLPPAFYPQKDLIPKFLPVSQAVRERLVDALAYKGPVRGWIPLPGGALVGLLLMLNLVAAKVTRFKIHASGTRLAGGIAVIIAGLVVTAGIVSAGHSSEGLQGEPPMSYQRLWAICLGTLAAGWVGLVSLAITSKARWMQISWGLAALGIAAYLTYSLSTGHRIGDPGLRIVWQLAKGLGAGLILLVGCLMVFRKQGGNVLLHFGVGLLMLGQFLFGDRQTEQRLTMIEGQTTNSFINLDKVELTFIQQRDDEDKFTAIPDKRLRAAAQRDEVISDPALPVDVKVLAYFGNSGLKSPDQAEIKASKGLGLRVGAVEAPGAGGTTGDINKASAYVELLDKESGKSLGTHLVSQFFSDREMLTLDPTNLDEFDTINIGDEEYKVGLRFARNPKPFWVHLSDVRRVDYSGTSTPRDYRSFVRIIDPETGEDRREQIWMNNPLRYRGETYYQSSYDRLPSGVEMTSLQVVQNSGWLIPYVACSITALGMCVHFAGTLRRFVRRRSQERRLALEEKKAKDFNKIADGVSRPVRWPVYASVATAAVLSLLALVPWSAVMNTMRPQNRDLKFDMHAAGKIPVQFGGRVMPLAAYAEQMVKAISNKSSITLKDAPGAIRDRAEGKSKLMPVNWLMEVAIDDERLDDLPMFRIDATEVRDELGLPKRESKLFSLNEIRRELNRFTELTEAAYKKETRDQSFKEKKMLELDRRIRAFTMTAVAFRLPVPMEIPASFFPPGTSEQDRRIAAVRELQNRMQSVERMTSPGLVPPPVAELDGAVEVPKWTAFAPAFFNMAVESMSEDSVARPGIDTFGDMISAYNNKDPEKFNAAVDLHLAKVGEVGQNSMAGYSAWKVALERWDQSNAPTTIAMMLYCLCLVLGFVYLAYDSSSLRSSIWGILLVTLAIHTLVLLSRIIITGRAPVINLYSSAVFIGWAGVIFGIVQEKIFRYGEGNLLAAGSGVLALLVAYGLSSGDTMPVLQAVLDTQFWLGTHVITVTLGYAATMVAGFLGIRYLVAGWLGADNDSLRQIYRSIYGATCFGILFSFVGTVLGGLWADDSWGRFWGWDPKENGALLIVIWNAMMLHARWDGMAGARGFSILAIGGNIVTAWSYFGTNELGLGLHSYGFTEGVLMWLSIFILSQLAFIFAGLIFTAKTPGEKIQPVA
jgi:ABC-type transport system involved in cytochrome c biogenesis permease subunit